MRLELRDEQRQPLFTTDLGPLAVTQTERLLEAPPFANPVGASFGGEIALVGYTLPALETELSGKNSVSRALELVWQAERQPAADYTVFVHVLNADGTCCVWQTDAMPRGGAYPTTRWRPGEFVVDAYAIDLPADLPPGTYAVEVGLYIAETGQRLGVAVDGQASGDAVRLAPLILH